jgi:hypothetical protein
MRPIRRLLFCLALACTTAAGQDGTWDLDLLARSYPPQVLSEVVQSADEWRPFPTAGEREAWLRVPSRIRTAHIQEAEKYLDTEWPTPKASVFLDYVRDGNRSRFQSISFRRRAMLAALVLGECMEGRGRFLDDILNGVWTICEETYWGVPAHVGAQKKGSGLPDVTEPTVDLFAAETGMLLAWTHYLVGTELGRISPLAPERIRLEVDRRILSVNLERDDFWWMGFSGRTVNNWNPWICSNWLAAVLLLEEDPGCRAASLHKILRCLDNFLNPYPRDGGCDEGPGYWNRAGGSLFDCLELLHSASRGRIDVFQRPLIREIGRYIYRAHISNHYFINFADAAARLNAEGPLIFRYGSRIEDPLLQRFGAFLAEQQSVGEGRIQGSFGILGRVLPALFGLHALVSVEPAAPMLRDVWLPELQVMSARSSRGSTEGLYVAAKGGHNDESHNHNDVGNFIVYADGYPALIDVGVETYTAKTFSDSRYEIWTMRSEFHNLPTINGVAQQEGREYRAGNVKYEANDRKAELEMDLHDAYPEEASVKFWRRTITLNRGRDLILRDRYELDEARFPVSMTLMSSRRPSLSASGTILLANPEQIADSGPVSIRFDQRTLLADIEEIPIKDSRLRSSWGERIYRIRLTAKEAVLRDVLTLRIEQR